MIAFRVGVKGTEALDLIQQLGKVAPALIQDAGIAVGRQLEPVIEADLQQEPPPLAPGVFRQLATPRQFRYVMAKLKAQGQLDDGPGHYQRTHAATQGWQVVVSARKDGTVITIQNPWRGSIFLWGPQQQPFHAGRWPTLRKNARDRSYFVKYDELATALMRKEIFSRVRALARTGGRS